MKYAKPKALFLVLRTKGNVCKTFLKQLKN